MKEQKVSQHEDKEISSTLAQRTPQPFLERQPRTGKSRILYVPDHHIQRSKPRSSLRGVCLWALICLQVVKRIYVEIELHNRLGKIDHPNSQATQPDVMQTGRGRRLLLYRFLFMELAEETFVVHTT